MIMIRRKQHQEENDIYFGIPLPRLKVELDLEKASGRQTKMEVC